MALKDQIQNDMKAALLSGNRFAGNVLRDLKAAILNEEVAQNKRDEGISDTDIEKVVAKEVKKRNEAAALYDQNMRDDAAEQERKEAAVLQQYLPKQLSEAEVKTVVDAKIVELHATDMKLMGQVIGAVKAELGNTADGALISKIVKTQLNK